MLSARVLLLLSSMYYGASPPLKSSSTIEIGTSIHPSIPQARAFFQTSCGLAPHLFEPCYNLASLAERSGDLQTRSQRKINTKKRKIVQCFLAVMWWLGRRSSTSRATGTRSSFSSSSRSTSHSCDDCLRTLFRNEKLSDTDFLHHPFQCQRVLSVGGGRVAIRAIKGIA